MTDQDAPQDVEAPEAAPKTPIWFWVVGGVAVIWNGFGVMDFVMTQTRNTAYMAGFTPEQLEFFYGFPAWYVGIWGLAVFAALFASLGLLIKSRYAVELFLASMILFVLNAIYIYGFTPAFEIMGGMGQAIFSAVIFATLVAFWRVGSWAAKAGILR